MFPGRGEVSGGGDLDLSLETGLYQGQLTAWRSDWCERYISWACMIISDIMWACMIISDILWACMMISDFC